MAATYIILPGLSGLILVKKTVSICIEVSFKLWAVLRTNKILQPETVWYMGKPVMKYLFGSQNGS